MSNASLPATTQRQGLRPRGGVRPYMGGADRSSRGRARGLAGRAAASNGHREFITLLAATAAAAVGLATTLYVDVYELNDTPVRPVQLVPVLLCGAALFLPATQSIARPTPFRTLLLAWCGYSIVRFTMIAPVDSLSAARVITSGATFFAAYELSCRQRRPQALLIGLALGCVASLLVAWADVTVLGKAPRFYGSSRWSGLMPGPNRFADLCGLVFVISLARTLPQKAMSGRLLWIFFLATSGLGVLASGSRGGLAATAVGSICALWLHNRAVGRGLRLTAYVKPLVLLIVVGAACFTIYGDQLSERVWKFASLSADGQESVRDDPRAIVAAAAWKKFATNPVLGGGAGELDVVGHALSSHNSYLYLLSTSGLVGFVLCVAFARGVVAPLWGTIHKPSAPAQARLLSVSALSGVLFLLMHMWVIDLVFSAHVWAFMGFAAAIACRAAAESRSRPARRRPPNQRSLACVSP